MAGAKQTDILTIDSTWDSKKIKIFKFIMDNIPDFVFFKDFDLRYKFVNKMASKALGLKSPEEAAGKTDKDFFSDIASELKNDDEKVLDSGKPIKNQLHKIHFPDGKTRLVQITKSPVKNENGDIVGIIGISKDVTDKIKIKHELQISRERYHNLFEKMTSGVAIYEAVDNGNDFVFTDFNHAAEKIEQIKRDQVIGKRVTEVFPGVKNFGIFKVFQRVYETGKSEYFPESLYKDVERDGTWRENWVYKLSSGEIVAIYNDITDKKKKEMSLKKNEMILHGMEKISCIGGWEWDIEKQKATWTDQVYKIFGVSKNFDTSDLDTIISFFDKKYRKKILNGFNDCISNGKSYDFTVRFVDKRGKRKWVRTAAKPIYEHNKIVKVIGNFVEITKVKEIHDRLLRNEEKFRTIADFTYDWEEWIDNDQSLLYVSPSFKRITGYDTEEYIENPEIIKKIIHPEDQDLYFNFINEAISHQYEKRNITFRIIDNNGKTRWIELYCQSVFNENEDFLGIRSSCRDITEIKDMQRSLEKIFTMSSELICEADINTATFTKVNPAFTRVLGYSEEELYKKSFIDFIHPDDKEPTEKIIKEQLQKGNKILSFINRYKCKDGRYVWLDWNSHPVPEEGFTYAIARDITERKRAQQALIESENKYRSLFEKMLNGFAYHQIITDEKGRPIDYIFLEVNDAFEKLTGLKREEIIGKKITDVLPGIQNDPVDWIGTYGKVALQQKEIRFEQYSELLKKWYSVYAYCPKKGFFATLFEDINDIKKVQEKLKDSEEKYRSIFFTAANLITSVNIDGIIVDCNERIKKVLGYEREEIIGQSIEKIIHPDYHQLAHDSLKEILSKGVSYNKEYKMVKKNGGLIDVSINSAGLKKNGRFEKTICIIEEITEKKEAAKKIKRYISFIDKIMDESPFSMWISDNKGTVIRTNKSLRDSLNLADEDIIGKYNVLNDKNLREQGVMPKIKRVFTHMEPTRFSVYWDNKKAGNVDFKDSHSLWIDVCLFPICDEQGTLSNVICQWVDITKQKETQQALVENEEKYRGVVDNIGVGVSLISLDLKILFLNNQMKKWFPNISVDNNPLCYRAFNKPAKSSPCDYCPTLKTLQDGNVHEAITETPTQKGIVNYHVISSPIFDEHGKIDAVVELVEDVSVEQKTKKKIIEINDYLQSIIDSASELIISINKDGKIQSWNTTVQHITGYKTKEIIGKHISDIDVFENKQVIIEYINQICEGEKPEFNKFVIKTKEFGKRIIQTSYSPIKDKNNQINGILLIGKDVTDIENIHGKLVVGNSYLISDETLKNGLTIFGNLIENGMKGLCITRLNVDKIKREYGKKDITICFLDTHPYKDYKIISDIKSLKSSIEQFTKKWSGSVILLDRIDYLLNRYSFEEFINALYEINGIILRTKSILLLRLNPLIFDQYHLSMLSEELQHLPSKNNENIKLKEHLFALLDFVSEQNNKNVMVTYKLISKKFSIVNYTVSTRLQQLEEMGLIYIQKTGRSKAVYITDKGRKLLQKKDVL